MARSNPIHRRWLKHKCGHPGFLDFPTNAYKDETEPEREARLKREAEAEQKAADAEAKHPCPACRDLAEPWAWTPVKSARRSDIPGFYGRDRTTKAAKRKRTILLRTADRYVFELRAMLESPWRPRSEAAVGKVRDALRRALEVLPEYEQQAKVDWWASQPRDVREWIERAGGMV